MRHKTIAFLYHVHNIQEGSFKDIKEVQDLRGHINTEEFSKFWAVAGFIGPVSSLNF